MALNDDETQFLIYGRGFCLNPVVKLSTIDLAIDSVDLNKPQVIVANLPDHIDPAGYRLSVDCEVNNRGARVPGNGRRDTSIFLGTAGGILHAVGTTGPTGKKGLIGPTGATGATGPAGNGAAGMSGHEFTQSACTSVLSGSQKTTTAQCPGGKKLLGGGVVLYTNLCAAVLNNHMPLTNLAIHSGPTTDSSMVSVLKNNTGAEVVYRVNILCADG